MDDLREPFWSSLRNAVNTFKIRGSYGKVGNDQLGNDDRWLYQSTIITGNSFTMGETGNSGGTGIAMGRPENLDFSWEEETKLDLGVELMLFNQLRIQADYFYTHRTGILMVRAGLPGIAGLQNNSKLPYVNIGETENRGVDLSLEWNKQIGDWFLTARGNFTYKPQQTAQQRRARLAVQVPEPHRQTLWRRAPASPGVCWRSACSRVRRT